jgi:hypothetical protein
MMTSIGMRYAWISLFRYQRRSSSSLNTTAKSSLLSSISEKPHPSTQALSKMPPQTLSTQTSTYLDAVKQRRTVYGVTDEVAISNDRIVEIAHAVIQSCPSAWNMQSTRMLITLGAEHKNFWNTVISSAKPFVLEHQGEEAWERNETRFKSFQAAYGTVRRLVSSPLPPPAHKTRFQSPERKHSAPNLTDRA